MFEPRHYQRLTAEVYNSYCTGKHAVSCIEACAIAATAAASRLRRCAAIWRFAKCCQRKKKTLRKALVPEPRSTDDALFSAT